MTLRLSEMARRVSHSSTVAVDERLEILRAQGQDIIGLGAGQLDFETPAPVAAAGTRAIQEGRTRYTPVAGIPALRRAIQAKFERDNRLSYADDEVIAGAGAKGVIFHAMLALLDPDDAVIVPLPAWPSYASMVMLTRGRVIGARLEASQGYKLSAEGLMAAIAEARGGARGLILNSPHNPTGAVYSVEEFARLAEVVRGEGLWVISDEIYEMLVYDGVFVSFAGMAGMHERTVTVNGVSKAYAMTGWRIGYAGAPAPVIRAMEALQSHTSGNPSSIAQHAAEAALRLTLEDDPELTAERRRVREAMLRRRDLALRELDGMPGVSAVRPAGAFYIFADVSRIYGRELGGRPIGCSKDLAQALMEDAGVAVVPGSAFGDDRCIRLSFAAPIEELRVALQRIRKLLS